MLIYSELKDSGVDWIGKIPEHWEVIKPKYKLNRVTRPPEKDDEVITCFRDGIVTLRKNRREEGFTISLKEHGYQQVCPGDLVVHEMDGFEGAIGISDSKGKSTPVYTVIEPNQNADLRFISYLLRVMSKTGKIESLGRSIRERTTDFRWNMWSVINFPFPPVSEQKLISEYLNKKTQKIESLIEKTRKKIDLLKEQKTALINQYVTRGLDSYVEMKDSGIDCIGEIPKNWDVKPIKYIADITLGKMLTPNKKENMIFRPYLRSLNVQENHLLLEDIKYMWFLRKEIEKFALKKKDILVNEGGEVGRPSILKKDINETGFQNSINRIRFYKGDPDYLYLVVYLCFKRGYYDSIVNRVSIPHLTKEKLENCLILIPPLEEQIRIQKKVNLQLEKISEIIKLEKKRIVYLKEYNSSLISSVATGKIRITEDMI